MSIRTRLPADAAAPLRFAAEELERFLGLSGHAGGPALALTLDPALPAGGWAIRRRGDGIELAGADPQAARCAAHDLLERLGWRFEITGPVAPITAVAWEAITDLAVAPALPRRGVRLHINFPMDISAWPLDQALEYVRQLARLRLTHLTIHSYPGQWVDDPGGRGPGGFFYGEPHPIPDVPVLAAASGGQRLWCIPELEAKLADPVALAAGTRAWLQALIAEAKRVGLTVQFSFEPRRGDGKVEATLAQAIAILADYPGIDRLELISQEDDGQGTAADPAALRAQLEALLPGCSARPALAALLSGGADLRSAARVFGELAHQLCVCRRLQQVLAGQVGIDFACYSVSPRYLAAVVELWRHHADPATGLALLCAHGADRVARHLPQTGIAADEWRRVTVYSWGEIDGFMYLQQEAGAGLHRLATQVPTGAAAPVVAINHWRVAECAWQLRYLAEVGIDRTIEPRDFRWRAATVLGIPHPERVRLALGQIDTLTDTINDIIPNAAFCFYGCWGSGLGYLAWWKRGHARNLATAYGQARELLAGCIAGAAAPGAAWLRLMDNRLEVSRRYLQTIDDAQRLVGLLGQTAPADCPEELRAEALAIIEVAIAEMAAILALWCRELPDRASIGTAISLNQVTLRFLRRIRSDLAKNAHRPPAALGGGHDAPPSLPG